MTARPHLMIDRTHLGRRASGIERITSDLFSGERLAPLEVRGTPSGAGRVGTVLRQLIVNPLEAFRRPQAVWVFSGFPPSPAFGFVSDRAVLYVHDLFLVERRQDLNRAARIYMAPSFRAALRRFQWFLANSKTTADRLLPHVGPRATVGLYRPPARDALGVGHLAERVEGPRSGPVRIGMIGTIEPRKNYLAAAAICRELEARLARPVELHIVGRPGWGPDAAALAGAPNVHLHGFVGDGAIAALAADWSLFLSTSHDEGLGLPLLEVQHAGLPVVAPDAPVFREVLGDSGTFIDPNRPMAAAAGIAALLADGERGRTRDAARANLERWNRLAAEDHAAVVAMLSGRLADVGRG